MVSNKALEERVQSLERSMGTIVKALKEIKVGMNEVREEKNKEQTDEIGEILKNKKEVEDNLAKHEEAINRIEMDIVKLETMIQSDKSKGCSNVDSEPQTIDYKERTCRYHNKGFCKYKLKCRYFHSKQICEDYEIHGTCEQKTCSKRHPEQCKFWNAGKCSRNESCDFLHVTLASGDHRFSLFECAGCKNVWDDKACVVMQTINGRETFFCLNCQDWIKDKTRVFEQNWTLFDDEGFLRRDV